MAKIYEFPLSPERQYELYYEIDDDRLLYDDYYFDQFMNEPIKKESRLKRLVKKFF